MTTAMGEANVLVVHRLVFNNTPSQIRNRLLHCSSNNIRTEPGRKDDFFEKPSSMRSMRGRYHTPNPCGALPDYASPDRESLQVRDLANPPSLTNFVN
jgi:hypothetical protein